MASTEYSPAPPYGYGAFGEPFSPFRFQRTHVEIIRNSHNCPRGILFQFDAELVRHECLEQHCSLKMCLNQTW